MHDGVVANSVITNTAYALHEEVSATTLIETAEDPAWVLLVYLSADNNLDNPDFRVIRDKEAFNALEQAAFLDPRLRIYVQWDRSPDHAGDDHTFGFQVTVESGSQVVNDQFAVTSAEGTIGIGAPVITSISRGGNDIYLPIVLKNG